MRWEELSCDKVRRAQMRWRVQCEVCMGQEECSVKCGVWSVDCEVWRFECEECSVKCGLWSAQCEVWSVECEECSVKCEECGVWRAKSAVWRVQCEVCSVECEDCQVWSVKWSFKCDMWNKTPVSQSARTHGLGWRTAHASSIDEKGLIEGSLEVKLPTIWTDEKQSREEAERRERLEERRSEEKESEERRCRCAKR